MIIPVVILDEFTKTLKKLNTQMKKTMDKVQRELKDTGKQADKTKRKFEAMSKALRKGATATLRAMKNLAKIGIGALVVALTIATKSALEFNREIRNVNTILGDTSVIDNLRDSVLSLAEDGFGRASDLARGLYQTISAGVTQPASALEFLKQASIAAKVGLSTTFRSVDLGTTIMNAFGKSAGNAGDVFDKVQVTIRTGKTTMDELSQSLGVGAAIFAQAKIPVETYLAAISTLTAGGIQTTNAVTFLKNAVQSMINPTQEATDAAREHEVELSQAALSTKGFAGIIKEVTEKIVDDEDALIQLFGSIRAYTAVAALAGEQSEKFASDLVAQSNAAGELDKRWEEVQKTTSFVFEHMKQAAEVALIKGIDPFLESLAQFIRTEGGIKTVTEVIAGAFNVLSSGLEKIQPLVEGLGSLGPALGNIGDFIKTLFESETFTKLTSFAESLLKLIGSISTLITSQIEPVFERLAPIIDKATEALSFFADEANKGVAAASELEDKTSRYSIATGILIDRLFLGKSALNDAAMEYSGFTERLTESESNWKRWNETAGNADVKTKAWAASLLKLLKQFDPAVKRENALIEAARLLAEEKERMAILDEEAVAILKELAEQRVIASRAAKKAAEAELELDKQRIIGLKLLFKEQDEAQEELDEIKKIYGELEVAVEDFGESASDAWGEVTKATAKAAGVLPGLFKHIGTAMANTFTESFTQAFRNIGDLGTALSTAFGEAFGAGISQMFKNKLSDKFFESNFGKIINAAIPVIGALISAGLSKLFNGIVSLFRGGGESVGDMLKRQAEEWRETMNELFDDFNEQIQEVIDGTRKWSAELEKTFADLANSGMFEMEEVLDNITGAIDSQRAALADLLVEIGLFPNRLFDMNVALQDMRTAMIELRKDIRETERALTGLFVPDDKDALTKEDIEENARKKEIAQLELQRLGFDLAGARKDLTEAENAKEVNAAQLRILTIEERIRAKNKELNQLQKELKPLFKPRKDITFKPKGAGGVPLTGIEAFNALKEEIDALGIGSRGRINRKQQKRLLRRLDSPEARALAEQLIEQRRAVELQKRAFQQQRDAIRKEKINRKANIKTKNLMKDSIEWLEKIWNTLDEKLTVINSSLLGPDKEKDKENGAEAAHGLDAVFTGPLSGFPAPITLHGTERVQVTPVGSSQQMASQGAGAQNNTTIIIQAWDGASVDNWLNSGGDVKLANAVFNANKFKITDMGGA